MLRNFYRCDGIKCSVESLLIIYKALLRNCSNKIPSVVNTLLFVYELTLQIVFIEVYSLVANSSVPGHTSEPSTSQGKVIRYQYISVESCLLVKWIRAKSRVLERAL